MAMLCTHCPAEKRYLPLNVKGYENPCSELDPKRPPSHKYALPNAFIGFSTNEPPCALCMLAMSQGQFYDSDLMTCVG